MILSQTGVFRKNHSGSILRIKKKAPHFRFLIIHSLPIRLNANDFFPKKYGR